MHPVDTRAKVELFRMFLVEVLHGRQIDPIPVRAHVTVHSVDLAGTLVGLPLPRMVAREVFSGR